MQTSLTRFPLMNFSAIQLTLITSRYEVNYNIFIISNTELKDSRDSTIEMQSYADKSNQMNPRHITLSEAGKCPSAPTVIHQLVSNFSRPGSSCRSGATSRNEDASSMFKDMEIIDLKNQITLMH